jgi:hypothetical protein
MSPVDPCAGIIDRSLAVKIFNILSPDTPPLYHHNISFERWEFSWHVSCVIETNVKAWFLCDKVSSSFLNCDNPKSCIVDIQVASPEQTKEERPALLAQPSHPRCSVSHHRQLWKHFQEDLKHKRCKTQWSPSYFDQSLIDSGSKWFVRKGIRRSFQWSILSVTFML